MMSMTNAFYIGQVKLEVIDDSYQIKLSFVDNPPYQNKLKDLPDWALSSKNAIWFLDEDQPIFTRAKDGDKIKEELISCFIQ